MTGRELIGIMERGKMPDRIPFVPTIYEHACRVIDKTPSVVAVDEDLIVRSQIEAYKLYGHDLVSVGVDIYNLECEALGGKIEFPSNDNMPCIREVLVRNLEDFKNLALPDPEKDGRMPLFLNAAKRINDEIGSNVIVNGTITGPFTLAAILRGFENYIMDLLTDEDLALSLINFTKQVCLNYALAFIKRGLAVSINESWISPPLLSPLLYEKYVFPVERDLIFDLKKSGLKNVALISGGDTTKIAGSLVKTGTSLLMADYNTDQEYYKEICKKEDIFLRGSIESGLLASKDKDRIKEAAKSMIHKLGDYNKFLFGCGVVGYDVDPETLLWLKEYLNSYNFARETKV